MKEDILSLISIAKNSPLDIEEILIVQGKLDVATRRKVRADPVLANLIFGISFEKKMSSDYYFWDNTTLSLLKPLSEYVNNGASVLEIGPGPAATLSRYLASKKLRLKQVCSEIDQKFANSCQLAVESSKHDIKILLTDMTNNIKENFNVVFMNPPYVPTNKLNSLEITGQTQEFQAGYGGNDGSDIVRKFLKEVPTILSQDGYAILGINNLYLSDKKMTECVGNSELRVFKKYYDEELVPPFSQVYILTMR